MVSLIADKQETAKEINELMHDKNLQHRFVQAGTELATKYMCRAYELLDEEAEEHGTA